jgi:hypothetical protein
MTTTYQDRQREANNRWRIKNAEFLRQYYREKYLANRERILAQYREKNKKDKPIKPVKMKPEEPKPIQRCYKLFEVLDVLRLDLRHPLWGKSVREWKESDWIVWENLKNLA